MSAYGLYGHFVAVDARYLSRMQRPAVVSVILPQGIVHSILAYDSDQQGNVWVIDPLAGKGKYTSESYQKKLERPQGVVITDRALPELHAQSPRFQIVELQAPLHQEGYLEQMSGSWDPETIEAVKRFQGEYDLPVTGKVDALTWLLITGPAEAVARTRTPVAL